MCRQTCESKRPKILRPIILFPATVVLILPILLLVFLSTNSGCSPAQKPMTVKVWEFPRWRETPDSLDRFYWMRQQILEFEANHPEVSIELTELTWERGADKRRIAITAGVGPDIVTGTLPVQLVEEALSGRTPANMKFIHRSKIVDRYVLNGFTELSNRSLNRRE